MADARGLLHLYAESYRRIIANIGLSFSDMDRGDFAEERLVSVRLLGLFLRPNPIDRILHRLLIPTMQAVLERHCELETQVSCIRVVAACLAYERDNVQLPDFLADLVPAYIDAIPRDPWNGEALQYSRDKAIVYAEGSDLIDSGGSTEVTDPKYRAHNSRNWTLYGRRRVAVRGCVPQYTVV